MIAYDDDVDDLDLLDDDDFDIPAHTGQVVSKHTGAYDLLIGTERITCAASSKLRKTLLYGREGKDALRRTVTGTRDAKVDPICVGDIVAYEPADDGHGLITAILPRRNELRRADPGTRSELTVAANVDQLVIVFAAAQPEPKWGLLDRLLVAAEANAIPPLICLTKLDLADEATTRREGAVYEQAGYAVLYTSIPDGQGIEPLRDRLAGRLSVFVGKSGVGKTSLLNAIEPGLGLRTAEVTAYAGKGRHTTTHSEIFPIPPSGGVLDTPGVREFGIPPRLLLGSVAEFFPEMRPLGDHCRFGQDCRHDQEPDCAVLEAVADGRIAARRYKSYLKIMNGFAA